jgi:hypothetical protein
LASFQDHIEQSKRNLAFLEKINKNSKDFWDWQVTVAFYAGVHLINSHIFKKSGLNYRSHEQVNNAINPFNNLSLTKLDEQSFLAYSKLQGLSRRSRYLCNENHANSDIHAHLTYDKHFARAVRNLDLILTYISDNYKVSFNKISISCIELKNSNLNNFLII